MEYIVLLGLTVLVSLVLVLVIMPKYIDLLTSLNYHQEVSEYALKEYQEKKKTPIMGGLLFVIIPTLVVFIVCPSILHNMKAMMVITSFVLFCLVGFLDDILIIVRKNNEGLSPKLKLLMQIVFAAVIYFVFRDVINNTIRIPFFGIDVHLGIFYLFFMILLYATEANAVNFTDGMDGLCAGVSLISIVPFFLLALLQKEFDIALVIISIVGGMIGYLYYNRYPARIFMGDSGSIALGGLFSALAVILHQEIALFFIGGIFVIEMFCVCVQLTSVILFHKRVFPYTPIHYAFVLKGIRETRVVSSFYIIAAVCAVIGLLIGVAL